MYLNAKIVNPADARAFLAMYHALKILRSEQEKTPSRARAIAITNLESAVLQTVNIIDDRLIERLRDWLLLNDAASQKASDDLAQWLQTTDLSEIVAQPHKPKDPVTELSLEQINNFQF